MLVGFDQTSDPFCQSKGIFDLNVEVTHRRLDFRRLGPAERMGAIILAAQAKSLGFACGTEAAVQRNGSSWFSHAL